jgi:hypothetical protein
VLLTSLIIVTIEKGEMCDGGNFGSRANSNICLTRQKAHLGMPHVRYQLHAITARRKEARR